MPTMVFAGEFWAGASGRGLAEGFRASGWTVQEVDRRDFGVRPGGSLPMRVASRITRRIADNAYRRKLFDECRALKPDVFLTIKGLDLTAEFLRRVKEIGARTVMYYPDRDFASHSGITDRDFVEYDLFVTTKTFQMNYLEDLLGADRVASVPHGYSDCVHRPAYSCLQDADFRADVLHAGNHSPYKQRWFESAVPALAGSTFHLVGNRWRKNIAGGPLTRCETLGERTGVAYAEAIQTARINIAVHMGPAAYGWEDLVSTRTFEIPACRGFMLHVDNEEVREFFTPGEEIDVFSTPDELADKIEFYLARPELRANMIERAYERCVPAYSYTARAKQIANLIEGRLEYRAP